MKLVFLQSNPDEYTLTRHNISRDLFPGEFKYNKYIVASIKEADDCLLIKPECYYNDTGPVVKKVLTYTKSDLSNLIVIHDELDLSFKVIRVKKKSAPAGNNGIKSIHASISDDYFRIKIGIGPKFGDAGDFVLGKFSQEEQTFFPELQKNVEFLLLEFFKNKLKPLTIDLRNK